MKSKRRNFLKQISFTGVAAVGGGLLKGFAAATKNHDIFSNSNMIYKNFDDRHLSVIGLYGEWAAGLNENKLPAFSFRRTEYTNIEKWRKAAKKRLEERLSIPDIGGMPKVIVNKQYVYDGLQIEELTWQLPYGRATEAILLKPAGAKGKLPAILAFHDHGGNKYFGTRKITKTSDQQHPLMIAHQEQYYEGNAWANEIAKRGYVVLVPDAFPFASRRVMMKDVPEYLRHGLNDDDPERSKSYQYLQRMGCTT
jgi:hypothetical protein